MRRTPVYIQSNTAECGLACLAMVAATLIDKKISLVSLRTEFPPSVRGVNLRSLIEISAQIGLIARPLRVELPYLSRLSTPSVLHWEHNHFVVLTKASRRGISIIDPVSGRRFLSWEECSKRVTGVALEFSVSTNAEKTKPASGYRVRISDLLGEIEGLKRAAVPALLAALVLECLVLIAPMYIKITTDEVVGSGNFDLLFGLAIGFGLLVAFNVFTSIVRSWSLLFLSSTVNLQWQLSLLGRLMGLPVPFFKARSLADIASRFNGVSGIQQILTNVTIEVLLDGLMGVVVLVVMFILMPSIAWIVLISTVVVCVVRFAFHARIGRLTERHVVAIADQQGHFFETARSMPAIKIFGREAVRTSQWSNSLNRSVDANAKVERTDITSRSLVDLTYGLERVLTIFLGATLVIDGRQTLGTLIAYLSYRDLFSNRISSLIQKSFEFRTVRVLIDRLGDFFLAVPEADGVGATIEQFDSTVSTCDLTFAYSQDESPIFRNYSVSVAAGEHVVITGRSGCGKSTLINLLLGLLVPTNGSIRIGGIDVNNSSPASWRGYVSAVLQDDILYNATILENVSFFDVSADIDEVESSLARADILDEIVSFPMGLNSPVGEMGGVLSGGQKQRLLLARALYAKPRILFLDEAMSHISEESERRILDSISSLDITLVTAAHRRESIRAADRVIDLDSIT